MELAPPDTLFDKITDFLLSQPTEREVIEFKPSEKLDNRLHELLDKNGREQLTREERAELDRFLQINHLLIVLKAKARIKLANSA